MFRSRFFMPGGFGLGLSDDFDFLRVFRFVHFLRALRFLADGLLLLLWFLDVSLALVHVLGFIMVLHVFRFVDQSTSGPLMLVRSLLMVFGLIFMCNLRLGFSFVFVCCRDSYGGSGSGDSGSCSGCRNRLRLRLFELRPSKTNSGLQHPPCGRGAASRSRSRSLRSRLRGSSSLRRCGRMALAA